MSTSRNSNNSTANYSATASPRLFQSVLQLPSADTGTTSRSSGLGSTASSLQTEKLFDVHHTVDPPATNTSAPILICLPESKHAGTQTDGVECVTPNCALELEQLRRSNSQKRAENSRLRAELERLKQSVHSSSDLESSRTETEDPHFNVSPTTASPVPDPRRSHRREDPRVSSQANHSKRREPYILLPIPRISHAEATRAFHRNDTRSSGVNGAKYVSFIVFLSARLTSSKTAHG